jgi:hypothetical protein
MHLLPKSWTHTCLSYEPSISVIILKQTNSITQLVSRTYLTTRCVYSKSWAPPLKRPDPLGLKCDTITSPRRLVNTFIHQMIPDLHKRDKPIKVANNFKSWSTTRDISSEWGWSSPIYAVKQFSGPTATGKVGNSRNSYPISFFGKKVNKQGWVQTYSAAHLHPRNGEIRYNAWNIWSSRYFAETAIFYAGLFCKTFCILQSASSPKEQEVFHYYNKIPWTKPSRYLSSFPLVFLFKNSYWTSRPP